jgi:Family of unknown function (DUF6874)
MRLANGTIDMNVTREEQKTILKIVARATKMDLLMLDGMSLDMDLCATHCAVPLKLEALLAADDFNFAHDILGIQRHMDRKTGDLGGCFLPRFAKLDEDVGNPITAVNRLLDAMADHEAKAIIGRFVSNAKMGKGRVVEVDAIGNLLVRQTNGETKMWDRRDTVVLEKRPGGAS